MVGAGSLGPRIGRSAVVGLGETALGAPLTSCPGSRGSAEARLALWRWPPAWAAAGAATMVFALRDKPYLTGQERAARRAGQVAGVSGAAVGTAVAM